MHSVLGFKDPMVERFLLDHNKLDRVLVYEHQKQVDTWSFKHIL